VSPIEEDRARVALERARLERVQLEHGLRAAEVDLAATWGSSRVAFASLHGDLAAVTAPPPLAHFLERVDANPDLARWSTELEQRRAALDLERAHAIPDVTARLGARHLNEDDAGTAVVELSIPLPIFDRNQGGIAEARHRVAKAEAERAAADTSVRGALTRAYETLHAAFDQVTTLRDDVIPRAETVFRRIREDYARGLFRYLEVLAAQRTLFEVRSQYLQTLAGYHGALADVERLSGTTVADDAEPAARRTRP
jgi:cobalt-zinc-cadmium efflux system outer membrane protein